MALPSACRLITRRPLTPPALPPPPTVLASPVPSPVSPAAACCAVGSRAAAAAPSCCCCCCASASAAPSARGGPQPMAPPVSVRCVKGGHPCREGGRAVGLVVTVHVHASSTRGAKGRSRHYGRSTPQPPPTGDYRPLARMRARTHTHSHIHTHTNTYTHKHKHIHTHSPYLFVITAIPPCAATHLGRLPVAAATGE